MRKVIYSAVATATICLLPSCSLWNQLTSKKGEDGKAKSETTVKQASVLPQDRQAIDKPVGSTTYTPAEFAKGIIKGDWAIESVFGTEAKGEKAPFLKFSESDHRVYGNNGCNTINAEYEYDAAQGTLSFSNVAVTMMLCHMEGITDSFINTALNDTRSYSLEEATDGYVMNLYNKDGVLIMTLSHQNFEFLNGTWKVVQINDEKVNIEKMRLVFDVDEHKIHGNTGCNVLNGRLETDMDSPNSISFEGMAVTMMMCPQMEYQTALLVALEEACRAKPTTSDRVEFFNPTGNLVLILERTSDK